MDKPNHQIEDIHVKEINALKSPYELKHRFPLKAAEKESIITARKQIQDILSGKWHYSNHPLIEPFPELQGGREYKDTGDVGLADASVWISGLPS